MVSRIGSRLPMYATGVGKGLLAHAPATIRHDVLKNLHPFTAHTVVQPGVLAGKLARVYRDGYASTIEELTLGACLVAVPVARGLEIIAALGIVVPNLRRNRSALITALQAAAQGISRTLN